ncbi:MAG TPA: GNAT family N-acetyltransferase [Tissierellia bacterium]|nr:GNAT family N-acetyltransferase [Tissierellia bacterium]
MYIRKSEISDLDEILEIFSSARKFMRENGNPNQWGDDYPSKSLIENDILSGNSYVCVDDGKIVGTFFFREGNDPTYEKIYNGQWKNNEPYGVVHRIASVEGKKGVASFCLNWCFEKCKNIRIDTHKDNIPMQNLLKKNGYEECGIIYVDDGSERIAFQKIEEYV